MAPCKSSSPTWTFWRRHTAERKALAAAGLSAATSIGMQQELGRSSLATHVYHTLCVLGRSFSWSTTSTVCVLGDAACSACGSRRWRGAGVVAARHVTCVHPSVTLCRIKLPPTLPTQLIAAANQFSSSSRPSQWHIAPEVLLQPSWSHSTSRFLLFKCLDTVHVAVRSLLQPEGLAVRCRACHAMWRPQAALEAPC